jgi:hypothetical protein
MANSASENASNNEKCRSAAVTTRATEPGPVAAKVAWTAFDFYELFCFKAITVMLFPIVFQQQLIARDVKADRVKIAVLGPLHGAWSTMAKASALFERGYAQATLGVGCAFW